MSQFVYTCLARVGGEFLGTTSTTGQSRTKTVVPKTPVVPVVPDPTRARAPLDKTDRPPR